MGIKTLSLESLLSLLEPGVDVVLTMEPKQPKDGKSRHIQVERVRLDGDPRYRRFHGGHMFDSMWLVTPTEAA